MTFMSMSWRAGREGMDRGATMGSSFFYAGKGGRGEAQASAVRACWQP